MKVNQLYLMVQGFKGFLLLLLFKRNKMKGFTFLEVMLVLSLVGLLMGLYLPQHFKLFMPAILRSDIAVLASNLKWARTRAILNSRYYYFRIDSQDLDDNGRKYYYIYYLEDNKEIIVKKGSYSAEFNLYKNKNPVLITSDYYDRIMFTSYGTARSGTIGLGDKDRIGQVTVSSWGRVRIAE